MPVFWIPGGTGAAQAGNGGKVTGFNNIGNVTPVAVLSTNPQRLSLTFHNPGSVDVLVYPQTNAAGGTNAPTVAAPGGGFWVFANGGSIIITGECQQAWSALSRTLTGNPLTVMESNVA